VKTAAHRDDNAGAVHDIYCDDGDGLSFAALQAAKTAGALQKVPQFFDVSNDQENIAPKYEEGNTGNMQQMCQTVPKCPAAKKTGAILKQGSREKIGPPSTFRCAIVDDLTTFQFTAVQPSSGHVVVEFRGKEVGIKDVAGNEDVCLYEELKSMMWKKEQLIVSMETKERGGLCLQLACAAFQRMYNFATYKIGAWDALQNNGACKTGGMYKFEKTPSCILKSRGCQSTIKWGKLCSACSFKVEDRLACDTSLFESQWFQPSGCVSGVKLPPPQLRESLAAQHITFGRCFFYCIDCSKKDKVTVLAVGARNIRHYDVAGVGTGLFMDIEDCIQEWKYGDAVATIEDAEERVIRISSSKSLAESDDELFGTFYVAAPRQFVKVLRWFVSQTKSRNAAKDGPVAIMKINTNANANANVGNAIARVKSPRRKAFSSGTPSSPRRRCAVSNCEELRVSRHGYCSLHMEAARTQLMAGTPRAKSSRKMLAMQQQAEDKRSQVHQRRGSFLRKAVTATAMKSTSKKAVQGLKLRYWGEIVRHRGWCKKKGGISIGGKKWISRYLVLFKTSVGHFLTYFDNEGSTQLHTDRIKWRRAIDMSHVLHIHHPSRKHEKIALQSAQKSADECSFDIVTPEREWTFIANSREDCSVWLTMLSRAKKMDTIMSSTDAHICFRDVWVSETGGHALSSNSEGGRCGSQFLASMTMEPTGMRFSSRSKRLSKNFLHYGDVSAWKTGRNGRCLTLRYKNSDMELPVTIELFRDLGAADEMRRWLELFMTKLSATVRAIRHDNDK